MNWTFLKFIMGLTMILLVLILIAEVIFIYKMIFS